jgi:hypothetical protein
MFVYDISVAIPGNVSTSATANTESPTWSMKPGVATVSLQSMLVTGKGAGLTQLSGIIHRIVHFATASTGGVAIVPSPKDSRLQGLVTAKATVVSAQTLPAGPVRTNKLAFGHGATGPGGWNAMNPDSYESMVGGGVDSTDAINASGTLSLLFEWSAEIAEP